ncbi:hypothetical protein ACFVAD_23070 [Sutcliffiella sp. NPDC057660]|uniref:hypothetical protein n=1 Tax=Sutcliffiella sp. NPDC057660 TaxID=3346199 RepID=UPI0036C269FF
MNAKGLYASISLGVKEEEYSFVEELATAGLTPEYITIDIAQGLSNAVINIIQHIKKQLPESFVMPGMLVHLKRCVNWNMPE